MKFRKKHNLSPYEFCAFLYDFAPKYIEGINSYVITDLPGPKGAFFIGSSQDDKFLKDESEVIAWQCNPDTRAGDQVVMYLTSPISAVDSVWTSVSVGSNDPFFYYYRCTYIARPQKLKQIPLKQLREDAQLKELPIVRKNMQGINGVELLPSDYNHLLDLAESDLPRFKYEAGNTDNTYTREKDVEDKLVRPLLTRLGYSETEYQQQLYMVIGNYNNVLIPDFVVRPEAVMGHLSADFLIETKLSVSSSILLEQAKNQVRSYSKLLNAKYSVVASKEGIWIMDEKSDYSTVILELT